MRLTEMVSELALEAHEGVLALEWEFSQRSMPDGELFFLAPEFVEEACRALYLPDEIIAAALSASSRIAASEPLKALAWHFYHCLFRCRPEGPGVWSHETAPRRKYPKYHPDRWPGLEQVLGSDGGMFYLLVVLSGVPVMRAVHQSHSVPERIRRDNGREILARLNRCRSELGAWGLDGHGARWLANFVRGELYVVGRLEYQFASFAEELRVFRHEKRPMVIALAEPSIRYRADGQLHKGGDPVEGTWDSDLGVTPEAIIGNPILPTGRALHRDVHLPASEWREALRSGDPILAMHIPGGMPLAHEQCGESLRSALSFFRRHFPERPFKAFQCSSWTLDAQLEDLLGSDSNLLRFQREVYLYPLMLDDEEIMRAVFGTVPEDLSCAPRETRLQRAILDRLSAGERLVARAGGCFLLPDDLDWGSEVYRAARFPWHLI